MNLKQAFKVGNMYIGLHVKNPVWQLFTMWCVHYQDIHSMHRSSFSLKLLQQTGFEQSLFKLQQYWIMRHGETVGFQVVNMIKCQCRIKKTNRFCLHLIKRRLQSLFDCCFHNFCVIKLWNGSKIIPHFPSNRDVQ